MRSTGVRSFGKEKGRRGVERAGYSPCSGSGSLATVTGYHFTVLMFFLSAHEKRLGGVLSIMGTPVPGKNAGKGK